MYSRLVFHQEIQVLTTLLTQIMGLRGVSHLGNTIKEIE